MNHNPFFYEGPVTQPEQAHMRNAQAVDRMVDRLLVGDYYTVLGPRVCGATSLIWDVLITASQLEPRCRCVYVDLRQIRGSSEQGALFAQIARAARYVPVLDSPSWADVTNCVAFREALIGEVRGQPARLILALDGLDAEWIVPESAKALARCARVLYNNRLSDPESGKISVMISGTYSPYELSTGSGSPFNIAEKYWLPDLTAEEVGALIADGKKLSQIEFDESAANSIYDVTHGDRYFVQRLCHTCIELARSYGVSCVDNALVLRAIDAVIGLSPSADRCFSLLVRNLKRDPDLVEILQDLLRDKEALASRYRADVMRIQLSGVLRLYGDHYQFRNRIYQSYLEQRSDMIQDGWRLHAVTRRLTELHDVTLGMGSGLDPDRLVKEATWHVLNASRAAAVAVYLLDPTGVELRLEELASTDDTFSPRKVLASHTVAHEVAVACQARVDSAQALCGESGLPWEPSTCLWLPLIAGQDALGAVAFIIHGNQELPEELRVEEVLAASLANSIVRTRLIRALQVVGTIGVGTDSLGETLDEIARNACELLHVPLALVWSYVGKGPVLRVAAHHGVVSEQSLSSFELHAETEAMRAFLKRSEPLFLPDVQHAEGYVHQEAAREMGLRCLLSMPMQVAERSVGILEVYTHEPWQATPTRRALLKLLARQAATAIENAGLYQQLAEHAAILNSLYRVSTALRSSLNPDDVLDAITSSLQTSLNLATCTIGLLSEDESHLDFVAYRGLPGPTTRQVSDLPPGLWARLRSEGQPVIVDDVAQRAELARVLERTDLHWFCAMPLKGKSRFLGILTLSSTDQVRLEPQHVGLLPALADQAAGAIENAQLSESNLQVHRLLHLSLEVLSHQLQKAPGFVKNTIDTLLAGKLGELNDRQIDRLAKAQCRLEAYRLQVDNVNLYGRLKGNKVMPRMATLNLSQLSRAAVRAWHATAQQKGIALEPHLRAVSYIEGDRGLIEVILDNLLHNAIKFTPSPGCIRLEVWRTQNVVHLAVDDSGIGIPEEERARLFTAYHQISVASEQAKKGMGLGLYIVKQLVEMHGGRIELARKDSPGTRFVVILPAAKTPPRQTKGRSTKSGTSPEQRGSVDDQESADTSGPSSRVSEQEEPCQGS